ncbi:MAG: hypothetical protein ACI9N3_000886 [Colwellia sp.]|jgi:hypothetical protein
MPQPLFNEVFVKVFQKDRLKQQITNKDTIRSFVIYP